MSLRIVAGVDVRIQQGSDHVPLPASLRGALALSRPGGSTLILQTGGNALTLELPAGAAGQLAVALGSRELANGIEASLLRIVATHGQVPDSPGDDALAAALGVERDAITLTRKLASGDLVVMLDLAIPLSACRGTRETTSLLQAVAAAEGPSDQELHRALERLAAELGDTLAEFEERMAGSRYQRPTCRVSYSDQQAQRRLHSAGRSLQAGQQRSSASRSLGAIPAAPAIGGC